MKAFKKSLFSFSTIFSYSYDTIIKSGFLEQNGVEFGLKF